jgi:hypothetical protein
MYVNAGAAAGTGAAQFMANPMVSSPGWNKGYRVLTALTAGVGASAITAPNLDSPYNFHQLVQMKDAFGTQLLTGPGYDISFLVPLYSGQFGTDFMRSPANSPQFAPIFSATSTGTGNTQFPTYFPFEFAKGYGVISGANAALLPVLQINLASIVGLFGTGTYTTAPTSTITVDSDFYWLPNVPTDPPGIGTTCQWIYQPCNPAIPTGGSTIIQLPRLGGYLTMLIFDLRDSTGARSLDTTNGLPNGVGWPVRPKILVDGVPLIDSLFSTMMEDLAISTGIGAVAGEVLTNATGTQAGTIPVPRPPGTMAISRKTSLAQRDFGLLDTGEIFLSTNPGTQIEVAGYPWGTFTTSGTLNAIVGQVVPSGTLVQGLPEV